ncbi:MAG: bifunctional oligoribonuclease/PAP phosphatase NrnA [Aristaeellaceae bacterium]
MTTLSRRTEELAALIRASQRIALCGHVNPDGDTIGSMLALAWGLTRLGKEAETFCQDKVPDNLMMLPGAEAVCRPESAAGERYDLFIAVDVSEEKRLGSGTALMGQAAHTAQVDHHGTNPSYAQVNSVDADAPATGLLVRELLAALGVSIDRDTAMCLYASISTDTGNFAFASTSAEAFRVMAELVEAGLPLSEMNRRLFRQRARAQVLLLNRALNSLSFHEEGQITLMTLTRQDFEACGALPEHADTIVNFGLDMEGVRMAALLRETPEGKVKASLRAVEPARVDGAAAVFGGGGHAQASGCTLEGPIDMAAERVLTALQNALHGDKA